MVSAPARLTVLPPAPPRVTAWPNDPDYGANGFNVVSFFAVGRFNTPEGSPPFSYQWSRDGVPLVGATRAGLDVPPANAGAYSVAISNDAGIIVSNPIALPIPRRVATCRTSGPFPGDTRTPVPWYHATQVGDVVYFISSAPPRIERYDLAGERWLPTTLLAETPTAFAATPPASTSPPVACSYAGRWT